MRQRELSRWCGESDGCGKRGRKAGWSELRLAESRAEWRGGVALVIERKEGRRRVFRVYLKEGEVSTWRLFL